MRAARRAAQSRAEDAPHAPPCTGQIETTRVNYSINGDRSVAITDDMHSAIGAAHEGKVSAHQHINLTYHRCESVPCGRDEENYVDIGAAV